MRRFFIWSALAAVIGLVLAGGAYWAYWNYYARFQPITVTRNQADIQRLLDEASWVSAGGGGAPLYIIGYRDSQAMRDYEREEVPKLRAAGVEARIILFARPDREGLAQSTAAERATIAELWLTRDWTLYQRWTATPVRNWTAAGIPAADGNLARPRGLHEGLCLFRPSLLGLHPRRSGRTRPARPARHRSGRSCGTAGLPRRRHPGEPALSEPAAARPGGRPCAG